MDNVQEEVIYFLTEILAAETPRSVATEARQQLRIADEFESISDYVSTILKARLRLDEHGLKLPDGKRGRILSLHDRVTNYVDLISESLNTRRKLREVSLAISGANISVSAWRMRTGSSPYCSNRSMRRNGAG